MDTRFEIQKIKFNSLSDLVILDGSLIKGALASELMMRVQHSVLNRLLNRLQEKNPEVSVNEFLVTHANARLRDYEFNFGNLRNRCILTNELKRYMTEEEYRFIRA
jgi:uncharacterized membrane protein